MKKLFYRLSTRRSFATLFSLLSFAALQLWFVTNVNAQWGGGFGAADFGWSGQVHCDLVGESGGGAPSILNANPGSTTTPGSVTVLYPAVTCTFVGGTDSTPGTFAYYLTTQVPGDSSIGGDNDSNKGHGNTGGCDPGNPSGQRNCSSTSGVTCTNGTTTSTRTWTAACGDPVVSQSGVLTWIGTNTELTPPGWTGCSSPFSPGTITYDSNGNPVSVTGGSCVLNLGRFPLNKNGSVDLTACAAAFPANSLPVRGVLNFTVNYESLQCQGPSDPGNLLERECHDHNFTPTLDPACNPDSAGYHTGTGTSEAEIILADNQWAVSSTVNLKCDAGSDNGNVPTTVANSSSFDTATVSVLLVPRGSPPFAQGTPQVTVDGIQGSTNSGDFSSPFASAPLLDANGNQIGLGLSYLSCRADGKTGLAQIVCNNKNLWYKVNNNNHKAQVNLRIVGTTTDGTEFTGVNVPVNLTATDQCQP